MRAVNASVGGLTQTQYKLWVSGELAARPALASHCSSPLPTEVPSTKLCRLTLLTSQHQGSPLPFQNLWGLPLMCVFPSMKCLAAGPGEGAPGELAFHPLLQGPCWGVLHQLLPSGGWAGLWPKAPEDSRRLCTPCLP